MAINHIDAHRCSRADLAYISLYTRLRCERVGERRETGDPNPDLMDASQASVVPTLASSDSKAADTLFSPKSRRTTETRNMT